MLGNSALFYEQNGFGRRVSRQESLEILNRGIEAGLVLQPSNSQNPFVICMCRGCCCLALKNLNKTDEPAKVANTNYYAIVAQDDRAACGNCENICQMNAIEVVDGTAEVNLARCIGCGFCVARCEFNALRLQKKEPSISHAVPVNTIEQYVRMARERGL
jgi:electron transport complex protein RnfB